MVLNGLRNAAAKLFLRSLPFPSVLKNTRSSSKNKSVSSPQYSPLRNPATSSPVTMPWPFRRHTRRAPLASMEAFWACSSAASERHRTHPGRRSTKTTAGRSCHSVAACTAVAAPTEGTGSFVRRAPARSETRAVGATRTVTTLLISRDATAATRPTRSAVEVPTRRGFPRRRASAPSILTFARRVMSKKKHTKKQPSVLL
mmetsp:Transcript_4647/g.18585  ORF Transcript_4647/g.18585 Transcript_4647/m.18585 type:complete len:201 (-) Transcript_4647:77-679(-)